MSIRIIPQDELGSSEKRTADMIPPLLFPRLKNLYNRRAERGVSFLHRSNNPLTNINAHLTRPTEPSSKLKVAAAEFAPRADQKVG